jgi:enoyl-[acyl-carrier-protein] reductase (NADH)
LFPGDIKEKIKLINQIPLRRAGEHQELANLAAYLVSDFASYVNGEVMTIDGGEWLQDAGEMNFLDVLTREHWEQLAKLSKPKGS